jgi:hypothetical protein
MEEETPLTPEEQIRQAFEMQIQTLEDGTVVGVADRAAAVAAFAAKLPEWARPKQLAAFLAKHDEGRLDVSAVAQIASTYAKDPNALADALTSLYGADPRNGSAM